MSASYWQSLASGFQRYLRKHDNPVRLASGALLAGLIMASCSVGALGGGDGLNAAGGSQGDTQAKPGGSITYYLPPSGSDLEILPLANIIAIAGDEVLVLGAFSEAGAISEIRGLSVHRNGSDVMGYFLNNPDSSLAYYYQIAGSGKKLPRLIKVDASNADEDPRVELYDYDWATGASSLMASFFVSGSSGAYRAVAAYGSRDLDEIESSLRDAFRTFIEHRTHFVVDMVLSVRDYILARFSDEDTRDFTAGLEADLTRMEETIDSIESGDAFTASNEATERESTAKRESIAGFDSTSDGEAFLSNVQGGIKIIAGDGQKGVPNTPLDQEIQVLVVNEQLIPQQGVEVDFIYEEDPSTVVTDADGYARYTWILGESVGAQLLTARIKESAPLGYAKSQIAIPAETLEDFDFIKLELGGVAGATPASTPGMFGLSFPFRLSGTIITREGVDYLSLGADYLYFGSVLEEHFSICFPASGEGTYVIPIGTGFDYKGIYINPLSDGLVSRIGVPKDDYRSYGTKGNLTITVHQDTQKYWGEFYGVLEQRFVWQSSSGDPATLSVANGTFMFQKK